MEHEADNLKEKTRLSEKKLEYEREENERKHALEMKKLELQQISENQKAELASEISRETGGRVDLNESGHSQSSFVADVSAKLPKLKIPKFSGDKLKWIEFDSIFKATVDSKTNVSEVEKSEKSLTR